MFVWPLCQEMEEIKHSYLAYYLWPKLSFLSQKSAIFLLDPIIHLRFSLNMLRHSETTCVSPKHHADKEKIFGGTKKSSIININ